MGIDSTRSASHDPGLSLISQELQPGTPVAVVVSSAPAPKSSNPVLQGLSAIKHSAAPPPREQADIPLSGKERRAQAFEAQRQDISTQAGPSHNVYLAALDALQQRDFKPALGGVEIAFTPHSLLGGGGSKRVYQYGSSSREVNTVHAGAAPGLMELIRDKQMLITDLKNDLEEEMAAGNVGQAEITRKALEEARTLLQEYLNRGGISAHERRIVNA